MLFEIQLEWVTSNTTISFGSSGEKPFSQYVHELVVALSGKIIKTNVSDTSGTQIYVEFHDIETAQHFFDTFHEKISPRMFFQNKDASTTFIKPSY